MEEYLSEIRSHLKDIINNPKKSDSWKIQLIMANNFISSINNDEEREMHSKRDNIKKLFDSLTNR